VINQVIIAGRLIEDPRVTTRPGQEAEAELRLEIERPGKTPGGEGVAVERCLIQARLKGDMRTEVAKRYLERDRHVLVHGHLRREADGLFVAVDRFEFMEHGLISRPLGTVMGAGLADTSPPLPMPSITPAQSPAPAAAPSAPKAEPKPKVAAKPAKRAAPKAAAA
jgi:hypothetical protein